MITPATTRNGPGFMDLSGIVARLPGLAPESMQVIEKLAATANPPIVWDTVPATGEVSLRARVVQQLRELAEHFAPSGRMSDVASV